MKKWLVICMAMTLALTGCKSNSKEEVAKDESSKEVVIPKYSISDEYYKTTIPYEPGDTRGLVVSNLNNRLDIEHFEEGLMRIARDSFSTTDYIFQEGKNLKKSTVSKWLGRNLTPAQLKAAQEKSDAEQPKEKKKKPVVENIGLNPVDTEVGNLEERNTQSPIYLSHISEQDYMKKDSNGKLTLGGVVIGLAMNSTHYYNQEDGYPREVELKDAEILAQGKRMATEILSRMRAMDGMANVPIVFAIYKQQPKNSLIPGNLMATSKTSSGNMGGWDALNERYYLFPSTDATNSVKSDAVNFSKFKGDVEQFFPNFVGVIGRGFYQNDQLQELTIEVPMRFYGKAEVISFTQYVTGLILDDFPAYLKVNVYINTTTGPEAIIIKEKDSKKPYVHIYD